MPDTQMVVAPPILVGKLIELHLGGSRVLQFQQLEGRIRITSGHRVERAHTEALVVTGSIFIPISAIKEVSNTLKQAALARPPAPPAPRRGRPAKHRDPAVRLEAERAQRRAYRKKNREKIREYARAYRARKRK